MRSVLADSSLACILCLSSPLHFIYSFFFSIILNFNFKEVSLVYQDVGATKKYKFIVDEDDDDDDGAGKEVDENEVTIFDTVCSICDDGGEIFWYAPILFFSNSKIFNCFCHLNMASSA